jgi:hypothetical protein
VPRTEVSCSKASGSCSRVSTTITGARSASSPRKRSAGSRYAPSCRGNVVATDPLASEHYPIHPPRILLVADGQFLHHFKQRLVSLRIQHVGIAPRPNHHGANQGVRTVGGFDAPARVVWFGMVS